MLSNDRQIEFTRSNIDEYLKKLAKRFRKLNGTKVPAEIVIIGGAAVLLNYDFRQKSQDIDAIIQASSAMKEAINQIRDEERLPDDWINSDFRKTDSYSPNLRLYSKHYKTFSNIVDVRIISGEYLIAMKLMAGRQYKHDLSDVIGIIAGEKEKGNNITLEKIKRAVENLYDDYGKIPETSRAFIEDILKRMDLDSGDKFLYDEFVNREKKNKETLLDFERKYPNVLTGDNLADILSTAEKKKSEQN